MTSYRPWIVHYPALLLVLGIALAVISTLGLMPPYLDRFLDKGAYAKLAGELGILLVLAWFAVQFIERPLRTESAHQITETATREIARIRDQTVERLLRGWLPPAHFALLQETTLRPFIREDVRYRIQLFTETFEGRPIPDGYIAELVEYRFRVRNMSDTTQNVPIGMVMSKECAGVLDEYPQMSVAGEFEDGTPAFQPYTGPGTDKGEYLEFQQTIRLGPSSSVNAEIYTKEIRLPKDSEVLILPTPAHGIVVDFEFSQEEFVVSANALHPDPGLLRVTPRQGGHGLRISLPSPNLPGTSIEIKWRRKGGPG